MLVSVVFALSASMAPQAGIHQNSRGWIENDTPRASAPTRGDPHLVHALCIMISLLPGFCHQVKAPDTVPPEKHSAWLEVPTTGAPISSLLMVSAAGTDWDLTKEAMLDETLFSLSQIPMSSWVGSHTHRTRGARGIVCHEHWCHGPAGPTGQSPYGKCTLHRGF